MQCPQILGLTELSFILPNFCAALWGRRESRALWSAYCVASFLIGLFWWLRWWGIRLQCRRPSFDPWVRKILWQREWLPTAVFLPGESHGPRILAGYSPWGCKELHVPEWATLPLPFPVTCTFLCGWPLPISSLCVRSYISSSHNCPPALPLPRCCPNSMSPIRFQAYCLVGSLALPPFLLFISINNPEWMAPLLCVAIAVGFKFCPHKYLMSHPKTLL